jgi:hypothetical protein
MSWSGLTKMLLESTSGIKVGVARSYKAYNGGHSRFG